MQVLLLCHKMPKPLWFNIYLRAHTLFVVGMWFVVIELVDIAQLF